MTMATLNLSQQYGPVRCALDGRGGKPQRSLLVRLADRLGWQTGRSRCPRLDLERMPDYLRRDIGFIDWGSPPGASRRPLWKSSDF
ncbi:hypothetical protein IB238_16745 [Rhizobium sp. ARZ01]|uniref:hypothetical protein n=1 Tax=Rhizobium sp. ARZ01 TaxID=2769313 RepID=UPI001781F28D|nr:hypothetical protein [Rhizobium sp. ARZ01]MBD9374271.1 hypothetical protein [Rhizobium sp. ARZ01]